MTELMSLNADNTAVSDLRPLKNLTELRILQVNGTAVGDLSPLENLTSLRSLGLNNTKVSDVTPLSGLEKLHSLDIAGTQIKDLTPLAKLKATITVGQNDTVTIPPDLKDRVKRTGNVRESDAPGPLLPPSLPDLID